MIYEYRLEKLFNNKNIKFKQGDKILCFKSKRYTLKYCKNILKK